MVKKHVKAGWNGWRKVSGVMCDKSFSTIERKYVEDGGETCSVVGLETVVLRRRQEAELEVAEVKMLRFSLAAMRMDRIRTENIRETAHVGCLERKSERPD